MTASEMEQSTSFVEVAPPGAADEVGLARRDTRQRIEDLELVAQSPEIAWIRHQMGLIRSGWAWSTAHAQIASGFLRSQTSGRLFARRDEHAGLQLSTTFPRQWNEVLVLLRDPAVPVSMENIDKAIQCQLLHSSPSESLLRILKDIYVPLVFENEAAQGSVTKDFREDFGKFMATLTESIYEAKGQTLLYLPPLHYSGSIKEQAQNKELTQRLEQVIIRWTRQIKEVIRSKGEHGENEDMGPLAEIEFWRQRSQNMNGIFSQIQQPETRKVLTVLERFRSSYLAPFLELSHRIEEEAEIAEDNLQYLAVLEQPCHVLATCPIRDIPQCYPPILRGIRMIWTLSSFYSTSDKITTLLCLVSNEIIKRCCAGIPLRDVFDGDEESSRVALRESIHANVAWKHLYSTMLDNVATVGFAGSRKPSHRDDAAAPAAMKEKKRRVLDWNSKIIFAPVEAFLQRCQDMLEVCDAQSQFSSRVRVPSFAGAQGLEVSKSLMDAQATFKKLAKELHSLSYNLLDVKVTRWHTDYHKFKAAVVDLEIMVKNVMLMALKNATSLSESIELLEAFKLMACRNSIRVCVEKMTSMVFATFMGELTTMKRQFDLLRRRPLMEHTFPRFAGGAIWALHFQHRLTKPMALLMDTTPYLLENHCSPDFGAQCNLLVTSIEQYVQGQYVEWMETLDSNLEKQVQVALLEYVGDDVVQLCSDARVLALFKEVHYWQILDFKIPWIASKFVEQHHDYLVVFGNVFQVARDYNKLLGNMDLVMRGLMKDCVMQINDALQPSIQQLTWMSPRDDIHNFLLKVRINCSVIEALILHVESSSEKVSAICHDISISSLILLEKKRVYEISEFEGIQTKYQTTMCEKFERAFVSLKDMVATSYSKCASDTEDIYVAWDKYCERVGLLIIYPLYFL